MEKLLIVLVIVLAVIGIAQIVKVYELSASLSGRKEEDYSPVSNKVNGNLMLLFVLSLFAFFIYELFAYQDILLPVAASEHGVEVDRLLGFNWIIIFTVFFIVNFLLFFFAKKYAYDPKRKAFYLAHNNTLELVWTVIPSIVLAIIIIYGLRTWNTIMDAPTDDAIAIELYAKQFDWTARFSGNDGLLGEANFTMITGTNPLGLISYENIPQRVKELNEEIEKTEKKITTEVLPDDKVHELEQKIGMRTRQRSRVLNFGKSDRNFSTSDDDVIVKGEFHVPVNREINLQMRSRDVIHSAYMPHFRVQMNAVPGMTTQFTFTPTITTDSMRTVVNDMDFNFILLCNKVCGGAHYNMQMNVIVDTPEDYEAWLAKQKTFAESQAPAPESTEATAAMKGDERKLATK